MNSYETVKNSEKSLREQFELIEDIRDFMQFISEKFELSLPGNGKGFTIDIDGYLGAKALFIE